MSEVVAKLDDLGLAAWIAVMVLGFVLFWPVGLAILAYLIWSRRMGCGHNWAGYGDGSSRWERKIQRFQDKMERRQQRGGPGSAPQAWRFAGGFAPSGNRAFDEYRAAAMQRLEEEFGEFKAFLDRLREAKDKSEFDQFMNDRRDRPAGNTQPQGPAGGPAGNTPPTGGNWPQP